MKSFRTVGLLVLGAFALPIVFHSYRPVSAQVNPPPALQKWEYKSFHTASDPEFNSLGAQGWELCTALGPYPSNKVPVTFIFKRPVR